MSDSGQIRRVEQDGLTVSTLGEQFAYHTDGLLKISSTMEMIILCKRNFEMDSLYSKNNDFVGVSFEQEFDVCEEVELRLIQDS